MTDEDGLPDVAALTREYVEALTGIEHTVDPDGAKYQSVGWVVGSPVTEVQVEPAPESYDTEITFPRIGCKAGKVPGTMPKKGPKSNEEMRDAIEEHGRNELKAVSEFDTDDPSSRAEKYRDAVDTDAADARYAVKGLIEDHLQPDLQEVADDPLDRHDVCSDAVDVFADVLADADDKHGFIDYINNKLSAIAKTAQTPADKLRGELVAPLRERLQDSADMSDVDVPADALQLENGIALDEFVEERLKCVEHRTSTDHVADVELAFVFRDGDGGEVTMLVNETEHLYRGAFRAAVAGTVTAPVRNEIVSERIQDEIEDDLPGGVLDEDSLAADAYARKSLGPETRPWHDQTWDKCMTDLVDEHRVTPQMPNGPRTDAWEYIRDTIKHGQVTSNLADALDHSVPYYDDDTDEVWVPVSVADNAVENYSCTRRELYYELVARGVGTDNLSGDKLSEPQTAGGITERVYRLDATHDEVPDTDDVVENISAGGADALFGDGDAGVPDGSYGRATDGGRDRDDEGGDGGGADA